MIHLQHGGMVVSITFALLFKRAICF